MEDIKRVVLSTSLIIGEGTFAAGNITLDQARAWLKQGPYKNYSGHESVRLLGLEPNTDRETTGPYDEAICVKSKERLEFGREYSVAEIEAIGYEVMLICRVSCAK